MSVDENRWWLTDQYAPTKEEVTSCNLKVTGQIPQDLNGRLFRNGSNPLSGTSTHWFLSIGMIHGVELRDGCATWYRNRYVRSPWYEEELAGRRPRLSDLRMSPANTHVVAHAGKILALEETHLPVEVSPELDTAGLYDFEGKLNTAMTAHPKICPITGEMLFFGYSVFPPYITYHRVSAAGELIQSSEITVKGPTMAHDFNITRNYVVFMDLPLIWDLERGGPTAIPVRWDDDYGARLGVMPRDGSNDDVVWYEIEPSYVGHSMNAYEDGDEIVIDVCRQAHAFKVDAPTAPPELYRWRIDQKSEMVYETQLDDRVVEFPRVPDERAGLAYRYGYTSEFGAGKTRQAAIADWDIARMNSLRKYDLVKGTSVLHRFPDGFVTGEAVFAPSEGAIDEDDGYLLCWVNNTETSESEIHILSACHLEDDPVARIHLPARVPQGFHGSWLPD